MLRGGRGRAIATAAAMALPSAVAHAQDDGAPVPEVRWERPPEGTIERGLYGVPEWVVIVVGALVMAAAAAALLRAARRSRRARSAR